MTGLRQFYRQSVVRECPVRYNGATNRTAGSQGGQNDDELNKIAFGSFLAQLRKEKGMTQKELAAGLYVSDKAVSKNWLHVIKAMRVWCVVSMLLTPLCTEGAVQLERATGWQAWAAVLIVYILSLFGAIVIPAKKYE